MSDVGVEAKHAQHAMPFVRLELVVLSVIDGQLSVLLARRQEAPYAKRWALPGGVLRIDLDPSLDAAAQRVAQERLGLELPFLRQLVAVGGTSRDPRAPWALSVVYRALVPATAFDPQPGKRIEALRWCAADEAAADRQLAFDHAGLIQQAVRVTRDEVLGLNLPHGFVPAEFTLGELQGLCESILGYRIDKVTFRRRLDQRKLVEPLTGSMRAGAAHRPAQLYRLELGG